MTSSNLDTMYKLRRSEGRHESKFISNANWTHFIDSWLRNNKAGFKHHWPQRFINSIYFDDFNYSCYDENLSGASYREKLRLRWYGESRNPVNPKLEIKVKKNRIGWKFQHNILDFDISDITPFFLENLDVAPSFLSAIKAFPVPTLFVNYHRKYYISLDGRVRITVDEKLNFNSIFNFKTPSKYRRFNTFPITIVEIKYMASDVDIGSSIISSLPFKSNRGSKYVMGIQFLNDL